ncbi:MAG: hypothetical protein NT027_18420 [Proteobacteria bacterium]|nr:hypothetical protein [Pseudomonadota bacterium]
MPNLAFVKELSAVSFYNGYLMIGSTSDSHNDLPDIQEVPRPDLKQMFERFLNKSGIKIGVVDMDHLEFRWGVRVRGKSRLPIVRFLDSHHRIILNTGYYKSGITLSPLFATKIVDLILNTRS